MSRSSLLSLRLEPKLKKQLDRLSRATSRSRSFIAAEAIREYVALNEWQIEEIKKGVAEADRGEFATEKDVKQVLSKWKRRGS
ncbi:MAG TPA: ribbon-helix-helix protein, CopG family [Terriglobales bacterium]|nr:ribbon-helix-helix protein, CopG family [Terriglobales bacterium]